MVELAEEARAVGPRVGLVDLAAGEDTREDVGDLHTSTTVAYQLQSSHERNAAKRSHGSERRRKARRPHAAVLSSRACKRSAKARQEVPIPIRMLMSRFCSAVKAMWLGSGL